MCHWIRDPDHERERASLSTSIPPRRSLFTQRPAWVAMLAVVLVAVAALAALVFPSATTAVSDVKAASPPTPVIESTAGGPDDAVPSTVQASRGSAGKTGSHCNHDM